MDKGVWWTTDRGSQRVKHKWSCPHQHWHLIRDGNSEKIDEVQRKVAPVGKEGNSFLMMSGLQLQMRMVISWNESDIKLKWHGKGIKSLLRRYALIFFFMLLFLTFITPFRISHWWDFHNRLGNRSYESFIWGNMTLEKYYPVRYIFRDRDPI